MNYNNKGIAVLSIHSIEAKEIFNEIRHYDFRKKPLHNNLLNEKIYVYSATNEKAIIGYIRISEVLCASTEEILKLTGYNKSSIRDKIRNYFGLYNKQCYAYKISEAIEFDEYLPLEEMKKIYSFEFYPFISIVYKNNPLYDVITEWDKAFSLDGELCENPKLERKRILNLKKK